MTATQTPEPTTPLVEWLDLTTPGAVAFVIGVAMVLTAAVIIAWAIIRASKYPPPTALVLALSLLTLFAIAGGIATNNDQAWVIAGSGIGALAGSVVSIFQEGKFSSETVEKAVAVVQELEKQEQEEEK